MLREKAKELAAPIREVRIEPVQLIHERSIRRLIAYTLLERATTGAKRGRHGG